MYVFRKNPFIQKHFRYDTDDVDIFTPMFDESLHDNETLPDQSCKYTCGYCQTLFQSRNQLFHHLGFMGIDIRKCDCQGMCDCSKLNRRFKKRQMFRRKRKLSPVDVLIKETKWLAL